MKFLNCHFTLETYNVFLVDYGLKENNLLIIYNFLLTGNFFLMFAYTSTSKQKILALKN